MKRTHMGFTVISLLIACMMAVNMFGCSNKANNNDVIKSSEQNEEAGKDEEPNSKMVNDFAIRVFKETHKNGENTLISPLSVFYALAMTANGAEMETLEQMESVLGNNFEEINRYLHDYTQRLQKEDQSKLSLANSIWFIDDKRFSINQKFLQSNKDYYDALVRQIPFDQKGCDEINSWVKQSTKGMIPKIIDTITPESVMYLINAVTFEAEWTEIYNIYQVHEGIFTKEDKTMQNVEFMYSEEDIYLEDEKAVGFMKPYKGDKYAFVALLPNEGISVLEYIDYLNAASFNSIINSKKETAVDTIIPKFEIEYGIDMSEILKAMGMPRAFDDENAEFGGLGTSTSGKICIDSVVHKTYISVGEKGTKAGAATAVAMKECVAALVDEPKEVKLDRPFVYMILDCENNIPIFMGTVMDIKN